MARLAFEHVNPHLDRDWEIFIGPLKATLEKFDVPEQETKDVLGFVESTREERVEVHDMVEA